MIDAIKQWLLENFFRDLILVKQENDILKDKISTLHSELQILSSSKVTKAKKLDELQEMVAELTKNELTPIDDFLSKQYTEVPKFAYQNKRRYNGKQYAVLFNAMISPEDWSVTQAKKEIGALSDNMRDRALTIGRWVDRKIRWVSDEETSGMPDFYHYPCESLIDGRSDCESHSILVSSIDPDNFGIAFGNTRRDNKGTWHAWNVFVHNNELWMLETNSVANFPNAGNTWIKKASDSEYRMNWIFTKNKTFRVDGSMHFGHIAR